MTKYLWKQCTTSGASPKRTWERGRQNTLRLYGCEDGCPDCNKDTRQYESLMRLVERKRNPWNTWLLMRVAEAAGISLERKRRTP